jgi:hypothetical protein
LIHYILHADDTPRRIALGVGIGVFVAFTPTIGLQMVIALGLATLFRANKFACVPMVWISNPLTVVPIFAACFAIGNALVGSEEVTSGAEAVKRIQFATSEVSDAGPTGVGKFLTGAYWENHLGNVVRAGRDLWVGCIAVGTVAGSVAYFVVYTFIFRHRERRNHRKAERKRRRAERFARRVAGDATS